MPASPPWEETRAALLDAAAPVERRYRALLQAGTASTAEALEALVAGLEGTASVVPPRLLLRMYYQGVFEVRKFEESNVDQI